MKLKRLKLFYEELINKKHRLKNPSKISLFRLYKDVWRDKIEDIIENEQEIKILQNVISQSSHFLKPKTSISYYPIAELDAVVCLIHTPRIKKSKRDEVYGEIKECLDNSGNAYKATHDSLTNLLSREGFKVASDKLLKQYRSQINIDEQIDEVRLTSTIAVIAMDLDHFKQVNDTYGHQYGDIVLEHFAKRIEATAKSEEKKLGGKVDISIARLGGEEFNAFIIGSVPDDKIIDISEHFRRVVRETPLPSDEELTGMAEQGKTEDLNLPPINERNITVSIGVYYTSLTKDKPSIRKLESRADLALYSAKNSGRDVVRNFNEILNKYGRVIDFHRDTNIVSIDIGEQVNVQLGQEFLVYHPQFGGEIPFIHDDGRTKKRIGVYPKVHYAKITVFNVQNEISFCRLGEDCKGIEIQPKSTLSAIPLGSISHLVSSSSKLGSPDSPLDILAVDKLPSTIESLIKQERGIVAILFRIGNLQALSKQMGSAFINRVLAKLYDNIDKTYPESSKVAQMNNVEFAVIYGDVEGDEASQLSLAKEVIEKLKSEFKKASVFAGCHIVLKNTSGDETEDGAKADKSLEFARYAASDEGRIGSSEVQKFNENTAQQVVYSSRLKRNYGKGRADYDKLAKFGVNTGHFHNQGALLGIASNDLDFALMAIEQISFESENIGIFYANYGLILFALGRYLDANRAYEKSIELDDVTLGSAYTGSIVIARYYAFKADDRSYSKEDILEEMGMAINDIDSSLYVTFEDLQNKIGELTSLQD